MNITANRRKTHHSMRLGLASMTSSAIVQINMTALFSCDMDIYRKGRLVIQNYNPKNMDIVLVIEIIKFL